jgi:hypothetical protein
MPRDPGTSGRGVRAPTTAWWLGLSLIVVVAAGTQWASQSRLGAVSDELANFPSGVALLATGRHADPTHPPLARFAMAVPLLLAGVDAHPDHPSLGIDWHPYGREFLFHNVLPWRTILDLARLPILLLCAALVIGVAREARRRWGGAAGLAAAAALAFEPTVLAHGTLATTDLALTLAVFLAVRAFERFLRAPTGPRLLGLAALVTIATLTRFAGLLLVPILAVTAAAWRLAGGRRAIAAPAPGWRWWIAAIGLSLAMVWAAYGFEVRSLSQDPQIAAMRERAAVQDGIRQVADAIGVSADDMAAVPIPAYSFLKGLGAQAFHAARQDAWEDRDFYQYLDGDYDRSGFRTYFLRTFLYKSTLPSLLLWAWVAGAGLWAVARHGSSRGGVGTGANDASDPSWVFLAVPPLLWVAACSVQTINIGHRYVLPAIPFLCLGTGWLVGRCWDAAMAYVRGPAVSVATRTRTAAMAAASVALVAAHAGVAVAASPDHLAFFNVLAGGTPNGGRHLADSNLDWGQDLPALDADARTHCTDGRRCLAAVSGTAQPADYGTPVEPWREPTDPRILPGPTTLYVSENRFLLRSDAHPDGLFPFLADRTPDRRLGASIRVYLFPGSAPADPVEAP